MVQDEDATKHDIVQDTKKKVPDEWFWLGKPSLLQQLTKLRIVTIVVTNRHCQRV